MDLARKVHTNLRWQNDYDLFHKQLEHLLELRVLVVTNVETSNFTQAL